jgi:hypothetical protein|tara:strand:+ start:3990 stop:4163 length:174 start_codon:yes stop_codon:yes gene_type:complete
MTKLIVAITGLLVAIGTLLGTISMTIGKGSEAPPGITIVLNSPEAYADFITNHPAGG